MFRAEEHERVKDSRGATFLASLGLRGVAGGPNLLCAAGAYFLLCMGLFSRFGPRPCAGQELADFFGKTYDIPEQHGTGFRLSRVSHNTSVAGLA